MYLASDIDAHVFPLEIQATQSTDLDLAMTDPHQAFNVCVSIDDYNHVLYYHIPPPFSE